MEYGLIGAKLSHSYSRLIHQLVGGYEYTHLALPTETDVRTFLEQRAFKAINVTIPYKRLVIPLCDEVEPRAAEIGAVNTIVNRGGRLYGYNTDYAGFAYLARSHGVDLAGKSVLILGTGGTSKTVTAVCRDAGARSILTASRTGRGDAITYDQIARYPETQIVINTTPAGMYPDNGSCLVDLSVLPRVEAVLDVVYNPFQTELLLRARERGIPGYCGFEMLVAQAVYAAELFTGKQYHDDVIQEVHHTLKRGISNLSLIGMPGCGKSTLAASLARKLDKKYVDLDQVIEETAGIPITEIFARQGEDAFRRIEQQAVERVSKESGQVIACGGGVVKTPGNVRLLHQNGPVLWVRRPVEFLAMTGRPLSTGRDALMRMQAERSPLYDAASDAAIDNTTTLQQTVEAAAEAFEHIFDYR